MPARPRTPTSSGVRQVAVGSLPLASEKSATGGMHAQQRVVIPATEPTSALVAEGSIPRPSIALEIVTPLHWQNWDSEFKALTLSDFSDVVHGLRFGFSTGVKTSISSTIIAPNHRSALANPIEIQQHIETELALRRYSGPFTQNQLESLIGYFRTSPLGIVPKPNSSKNRVIQDLSYPRRHGLFASVNSEINPNDFPCEWGTFAQCFFLSAKSPAGTQVATFDVDSAYRQIPVLPAHHSHFCVQWEEKFYVDHCLPFGSASACGIFGRVADSFVSICLAHNVDAILKWVDDMIFFRFPKDDNSFSFSSSLIFKIAYRLGWRWKLSKHKDFSHEFTYLGFLWNLQDRFVSIPDDKKQKYLLRITSWSDGSKKSLKDSQTILGTLNHCCLVIPDGRTHLYHLSRFTGSFSTASSPFIKHSVPNKLRQELLWWEHRLSKESVGCRILQPPDPLDVPIFVDASTSFGVGILINNKWAAFKFKRLPFHDIGFAEMIAVELCVSFLTILYPSNSHFLIKSDNQGVIGAINKGISKGLNQNSSLSRLSSKLLSCSSFISASYVPSNLNLADPLSRGILPGPMSRLKLSIPLHDSVSDLMFQIK